MVSNSLARAFATYAEDWKKPIAFYGKVVDEEARPLDGVKVLFQWNDLSPSGTSKAEGKSDTNGLFSLTGVTGRVLSVELSKPGYRVVRKEVQFNFEYARQYERNYHTPDADKPVLFRLRKAGAGADLITSQYGVKRYLEIVAPLDGRPVAVDLMARSTGETGQMLISQLKPEYERWKDATEWSFRMEIPDGGFVEHADEFPYFAPEAGYQPVVELRFKKDEDGWTTRVERQYYFAFGSPRRYGCLTLETWIDSRGARLKYAINPDGSRYLEPKERREGTGRLTIPGAVFVPLKPEE